MMECHLFDTADNLAFRQRLIPIFAFRGRRYWMSSSLSPEAESRQKAGSLNLTQPKHMNFWLVNWIGAEILIAPTK